MNSEIEFLLSQARQHVAVAKEAKVMGWPRLADYSIRSAERFIAEAEALKTGESSE